VNRDLTHLLLQAGLGDVEAFDDLVRQTQTDVHRFCQSLVGFNEASDVAQETFVRAWRSAHTFTGSANGRTWLFGVARNVAADHRRRFARRARIRSFLSLSSTPIDSAQSAAHGKTSYLELADRHRFDEYAALNELVDKLEPDRREAFVLTQVIGFSYAEVAAICAVPVGTIRSRVARARESLAIGYSAANEGTSQSHTNQDGRPARDHHLG
jgi:RNA polymerase sigma-70 factor, ECF subfamily